MRKKILPLLILLFLTGCSKIDVDSEYKDIVNNILSFNNNNVNTASVGYKYYIPIGVNLVYDGEYNKKFKVKDTNIVLYVDIISYYYKNTLNYELDSNTNNYYYSKINDGYMVINNSGEDEYFLKIVYNYAKVEAYVKKEYLIDVISYSTIILNSIKYNDNLISNLIENGQYSSNEIEYEIDKPDDSESKFSQYLQEYVVETDEEVIDILPEN